jgi:tetratricopeptide (TPR) repeat protein
LTLQRAFAAGVKSAYLMRVLSVSMKDSRAFQRRFRPLSFALLFIFFAVASGVAQPASTVNDPRVQTLYAEAKAAQSGGDEATAIVKYNELLKVAPGLAPAYNNLGMLYIKQREYPQAADVLKKGLKVAPGMSSASALLGMALYQMGKYADARAPLEAAVRANPADTNAQLLLARALIALKEPEAAAARLHQLAQRQPNDQEVWYLLGKLYMQLSEQALARMNAIDPNSAMVHEVSGEMMEDMKNYDGALVEYKKSVEMSPQEAGAHYKLGNVYWDLSQWDAATEQFRAELVNDPGNCRAHAQLGNILIVQQEKPEDGLRELDKALAICPDLLPARVDRGRALLNLNRNEEALSELQSAEHASPEAPTAHFFLAKAYRSTGNAQKAEAEMQIFSKLEESAQQSTAARAEEVIKAKESSR